MSRRKRARKQRVALRRRRRSALLQLAGRAAVRLGALAGVGGLLYVAVGRPDSWVDQILRRHTPAVEVRLPKALIGLPVLPELPPQRILLWLPRTTERVGQRLQARYPAVAGIRVERAFAQNRVLIHVESRTPLVRAGAGGLDAHGVQFPLPPGSWDHLPAATLSPGFSRPAIGHWLQSLTRRPALWGKIVRLRDDPRGNLILETASGTEITWGPPEALQVGEKADLLGRVLEDAHLHRGGTARADLRFFDEGRIIIKPKSLRTIGGPKGGGYGKT